MLDCYKGMAQPWYCDVMGHMNIRHYMAMFDEASYQLLFQVFGWSGSGVTNKGEGWVDVRHVIDYEAEVNAGDLLRIGACITKIGTKSITIRYDMQNRVKGELSASLDCVCVLFDLKARKAVPLSDEQKRQAEKHMESS